MSFFPYFQKVRFIAILVGRMHLVVCVLPEDFVILFFLKFTFSEKATKMTVCSNRQIDGEDFVNFCGLLRKHELYRNNVESWTERERLQEKVILKCK